MLCGAIAYVGNVADTSFNKQCCELTIVDPTHFEAARVLRLLESAILIVNEEQLIPVENLLYRDDQFVITNKSLHNNICEQQLSTEVKAAARQLLNPQPT